MSGHPQQEHETSHGSMSSTKWAIEDGSIVEVNGRKFGANDDGAPLLVYITILCPQSYTNPFSVLDALQRAWETCAY
jgi:hypothetical protein